MKILKINIALMFLALAFVFTITSCTNEDPSSPQVEHFEPEGWVLIDAAGTRFMTIWQGKFDEGSDTSMTIQAGVTSDHIDVKFLNSDKEEINAPEDEDHSFGWEIANEAIAKIDQDEPGEYEFHLKGIEAGTTTLELFVLHEGHVDVRTIKIPIIVE